MNADLIRAVASLWPLALIGLLFVALLVALVFFRSECRSILANLKNLHFRRGKTQISMNQAGTLQVVETLALGDKGTTASATDVGDEPSPTASSKSISDPAEIALELDPEWRPMYFLMKGDFKNAEESFEKWQEVTSDPDRRIMQESDYLQMRFEKGDTEARKRLLELERRARGHPAVLGYVQRADANCLSFSRQYDAAATRFKESAASCVTPVGKATSFVKAAGALFRGGAISEAQLLLKEQLLETEDGEAKIALYEGLAEVYKLEDNPFARAISLQRALSLRPNAVDLNFSAGYACSEANLEILAVLHYERLVEIAYHHTSALNNLGVAYQSLRIPALAVQNYKRAIQEGETLASSNLAKILIGAGVLDEAERVLKETEGRKDIHQNVNQTYVQLRTAEQDAKDARSDLLKLGVKQQSFLLAYADALLDPKPQKPPVDGVWRDSTGETVELNLTSANKLTLNWNEKDGTGTTKWSFEGVLATNTARGALRIWQTSPFAAILEGKVRGSFEAYGNGFLYYAAKSDSLHIFASKTDNSEERTRSFRRATPAGS